MERQIEGLNWLTRDLTELTADAGPKTKVQAPDVTQTEQQLSGQSYDPQVASKKMPNFVAC
jgi:hypothetical protein